MGHCRDILYVLYVSVLKYSTEFIIKCGKKCVLFKLLVKGYLP